MSANVKAVFAHLDALINGIHQVKQAGFGDRMVVCRTSWCRGRSTDCFMGDMGKYANKLIGVCKSTFTLN